MSRPYATHVTERIARLAREAADGTLERRKREREQMKSLLRRKVSSFSDVATLLRWYDDTDWVDRQWINRLTLTTTWRKNNLEMMKTVRILIPANHR